MILVGLALATAEIAPASCHSAEQASPRVQEFAGQWLPAIARVRDRRVPPKATVVERVRHLVEIDEVTRANLWRIDDAKLPACEMQFLEMKIGGELRRIDAENVQELKKLLPADGWFRNGRDGYQVTHGAWLIAQHSPDVEFRAYALKKLEERLPARDVDPKDYALTFDRVQMDRGLPQRFGSQIVCSDGKLAHYAIANEAEVDRYREAIGWGQSIAETAGDLEVGKPCAL
jgi:hypothetical protein